MGLAVDIKLLSSTIVGGSYRHIFVVIMVFFMGYLEKWKRRRLTFQYSYTYSTSKCGHGFCALPSTDHRVPALYSADRITYKSINLVRLAVTIWCSHKGMYLILIMYQWKREGHMRLIFPCRLLNIYHLFSVLTN